MSAFNFKKGRPLFGHNTKRVRSEIGVQFTDEYQQDFDLDVLEQELHLPFEQELEIEHLEETLLEPIYEEAAPIPTDNQGEMPVNNFNEYLRGAKLLQGSIVTVNLKLHFHYE
jgi:hypothetical protein